MCEGFRCLSLVLMCTFVITVVFGGSPRELKTILDKQNTTTAQHLEPRLSTAKENDARQRQQFVDVRTQEADHEAEASRILEPSISIAHLGGYDGYNGQGYRGLGGENYGLEKSSGGFYGNQNIGSSQGEVGFYGVGGSRGVSNLASANSYGGSNAAKHGSGADAGYYGDAAGARRGHNIGSAYYGDRGYNRNGVAMQGIGSRGGHRKGHHAAGFHNVYHKDESGKTSSFYDDGADEGAHYNYDARDGAYKDLAANVQGGGFQDGAYEGNQRARQGNYGASAAFDARQGNKGVLASGRYLDDQQRYGLGRSANKYGNKAYDGQQGGDGAYYYGQNAGHYQNVPSVITGGYLIPATPSVLYDDKSGTSQSQVHYPIKSNMYYSPHELDKQTGLILKDFDGVEQTVKGLATVVDGVPHHGEVLLADQNNNQRVYFDSLG